MNLNEEQAKAASSAMKAKFSKNLVEAGRPNKEPFDDTERKLLLDYAKLVFSEFRLQGTLPEERKRESDEEIAQCKAFLVACFGRSLAEEYDRRTQAILGEELRRINGESRGM